MPTDWSNIGKAKVWGKQGRYFPPGGEFKLKVLRTYTIRTRNKGDAFIADFEVLESDHDDVEVGKVYNWYQGMQDEDIAFSSIKGFMLALLGIDDEDEEEMEEFDEKLPKLMEEAGSDHWNTQKAEPEDHPLHGQTVALSTSHKTTKDDKDFTVHDWEPWEPEESEDDDDDDDDDEDDDD